MSARSPVWSFLAALGWAMVAARSWRDPESGDVYVEREALMLAARRLHDAMAEDDLREGRLASPRVTR